MTPYSVPRFNIVFRLRVPYLLRNLSKSFILACITDTVRNSCFPTSSTSTVHSGFLG